MPWNRARRDDAEAQAEFYGPGGRGTALLAVDDLVAESAPTLSPAEAVHAPHPAPGLRALEQAVEAWVDRDETQAAFGRVEHAVTESTRLVTVTSTTNYEAAVRAATELRDAARHLDVIFDPVTRAAHRVHQTLTSARSKASVPALDAARRLERLAGQWHADQERVAKDHAREEQTTRDEAARAATAAAATTLDAQGRTAEASSLRSAPIVAPPVVPAAPPTVAGETVRRTWKAEVTDLKALVKGIAEGRVPLDVVKPDLVTLRKYATALKNTLVWPGVRAVCETKIAQKRRRP